MKYLSLLLIILLISSCSTTVSFTTPNKTATQEIIQYAAIVKATESIITTIPPIPSAKVTSDCVDKNVVDNFKFFISKDLHIPIVKNSDYNIILYCPVNSINSSKFYWGVPSIPITPTFTFPSISLFKDTREVAITKLNVIIMDKDSVLLAISGKYGVQNFDIFNSPIFGERVSPKLSKKEIKE